MMDSGYKREDLDRMLGEILAAARLEESEKKDAGLKAALEIGMREGQVIAISDVGTVILRTSRALIDARVAAVKAALARRAGLDEAIAWANAAHPDWKLDGD